MLSVQGEGDSATSMRTALVRFGGPAAERLFLCTLTSRRGSPETVECVVSLNCRLTWLQQLLSESRIIQRSVHHLPANAPPTGATVTRPDPLHLAPLNAAPVHIDIFFPTRGSVAKSIVLELLGDQRGGDHGLSTSVQHMLAGLSVAVAATISIAPGLIARVADLTVAEGYRGVARVTTGTRVMLRSGVGGPQRGTPTEGSPRPVLFGFADSAATVAAALRLRTSVLVIGPPRSGRKTLIRAEAAKLGLRCVLMTDEIGAGAVAAGSDECGLVDASVIDFDGDDAAAVSDRARLRRIVYRAVAAGMLVVCVASRTHPTLHSLFPVALNVHAGGTEDAKRAMLHHFLPHLAADGRVIARALGALQTASLAECSEALASMSSMDADAVLRALTARLGAPRPQSSGFESLGGLEDVKARLRDALFRPLEFPAAFRRFNVRPPRGILLHGPPGCAKTSLVKAICGAGMFAFIYIDAASLLSAYVGEAEANLRSVFQRARQGRTIVFFDEIDAIGGRRSSSGAGGGVDGEARLLSTLLTEMDGVGSNTDSCFIGATNLRDSLDSALLRPGRFDFHIEVPLPDEAGRYEILTVLLRPALEAGDVSQTTVERLASATPGLSGADLTDVVRQGCTAAAAATGGSTTSLDYILADAAAW